MAIIFSQRWIVWPPRRPDCRGGGALTHGQCPALFAFARILVAMLTLGLASARAGLPAIQLDASDKVTLLGVTHGARHFPPNYELIGGSISNASWLNSRDGATGVWLELEHPAATRPGFQLLVGDQAATASVVCQARSASRVRDGVDVYGYLLDAYPREESNIVLRLASTSGGARRLVPGQFLITNETRPLLTNWVAEPMPARKSDGDLQVTLTRLRSGAPWPDYVLDGPPDPADPYYKCVRIAFDVRAHGESETNWRPVDIETADGTGNRIKSSLYRYSRQSLADGYFYQPALWQTGSPWQVRLEFSRMSGYATGEILSLTNLPVQLGSRSDADDQWTSDTNALCAETTIKGIHLKILPPLIFANPDDAGRWHLRLLIKASPNPGAQGIHLTLIHAIDGEGHELQDPYSPWAVGTTKNFAFEFVPATLVKTLSLSFAVNQSRFVTFTVQPEKP